MPKYPRDDVVSWVKENVHLLASFPFRGGARDRPPERQRVREGHWRLVAVRLDQVRRLRRRPPRLFFQRPLPPWGEGGGLRRATCRCSPFAQWRAARIPPAARSSRWWISPSGFASG